MKSLFVSIILLSFPLYGVNYELLFRDAKSGDLTLFSTFIENNAFIDVNTKDDKGNTLLYYAVKYGHLPIVDILINAGAYPHTTNNQGTTAFQIATTSMNLHKYRFCRVAGILLNNCYDSYIREFQPDNLHITLWGHLITLWYNHYIADYDIVQSLRSYNTEL